MVVEGAVGLHLDVLAALGAGIVGEAEDHALSHDLHRRFALIARRLRRVRPRTNAQGSRDHPHVGSRRTGARQGSRDGGRGRRRTHPSLDPSRCCG